MTALLPALAPISPAAAQHAMQVVSYDQGATPASDFTSGLPLNVASAVLGEPGRQTGTGEFAGPVTVFSPPFLRDQVLSIGEGGHATLRLSHYAVPQAGGPEIGVFTNVSVIDIDWPNGQAGSPVGAFGVDHALVSVSEDGDTWVGLGETLFDIPTNGYADAAATLDADFQQPFLGGLSSFDGLSYDPDILDLLNGSGGGKWLDLSSTGLSQIGFLRFEVPDDGDAGTSLNFELDAVSIANGAMGAMTVPEPAACWLCLMAAAGYPFHRKKD
jgi:hypothetical protein